MAGPGRTVRTSEEDGVEITIGVQNVPRELVVETDATADEVTASIRAALAAGEPIELTDSRGRRIIVPSGNVGYIEVGDEPRKVGFHTI